MFHPFAYDELSHTWLARFSGVLTEQDLLASDRDKRECMRLHGPTAGVLDFTCVESIDVTSAQMVARGQRPQIMAGQKRAIVANGALFGMMRMFGVYQSEQSLAPMIVRTLPEAYKALGILACDFNPVEMPSATH